MRSIALIILILGFLGYQVQSDKNKENPIAQEQINEAKFNSTSATLKERIQPPANFKRIPVTPNSFANYLRNLPLKPDGAEVTLFNGDKKQNTGVYCAVVDMPIGKKNLHQCADAVMRLKAEHLWKTGQFDKIHFNFTNGFRVDYTEWMKGRRMVVEGNKTYWNNRSAYSNSYEDFWEYMELIFMYAGTASLSKELQSVNLNQMKIGDVFIRGGHPGHAVIVADMAVDQETGEKVYLLAQSYMPAQETQILNNLMDKALSPWYKLDAWDQVYTPEWTFSKSSLKRFRD